MFFGSNIILLMVAGGLILAILGFGLRSHNGGVILMGIGFLCALAALVYRAIETFG